MNFICDLLTVGVIAAHADIINAAGAATVNRDVATRAFRPNQLLKVYGRTIGLTNSPEAELSYAVWI